MQFLYELLFIVVALIAALTMYTESQGLEFQIFTDDVTKQVIYDSKNSGKITSNMVDKEFTVHYKELGSFIISNQVSADIVIQVTTQPDSYMGVVDTLKVYEYKNQTLASIYKEGVPPVVLEPNTEIGLYKVCLFPNIAKGNIDLLNDIPYKAKFTVNTYEDLDRNIIYFIH